MSTEALNLDQAVEKFMAPDEPAQESAELEALAGEMVESEEEETEAQTEEVDSEVDDSEEYEQYDEEYDTDEESAEADDEPDYVEPEKITVKVDGEEVSVTLDDLKRSYSGQGKIQKGMQEAAEARKQAEEMKQQAQQAMQHLTAMYERAQQGGFKQAPKEPSRELFNSDPIGYMEAKMQYDADIKEYQAEQQQMAQLRQAQQQQNEQLRQQRIQAEFELMKEKIPELADPERSAKFKEDISKTASDFGYSAEELAAITDHRALMVLRDAMRWRRSQSKRQAVENKAKGARPVIKPQAKKTQDPKRKQVQQTRSKLKQSGSLDDALSLILNN